MNNNQTQTNQPSVLQRFADKYGITKDAIFEALVSVVFRGGNDNRQITQDELCAFLHVCEHYDLNPFLKEIYPALSPTRGLLPVMGIDGWLKQMNKHPAFDGVEVQYSDETITVSKNEKGKIYNTATGPKFCRVKIFRKDTSHPVTVEEYLQENFMPTREWVTRPSRMLRHKALIQGIRIAFGVCGVFDNEEVQSVIESETQEGPSPLLPPEQEPNKTQVVPPPKAVRTFKTENDRNSYVKLMIERCCQRGVPAQAIDFFKERLVDEDLEYAINQVYKVLENENSKQEVSSKESEDEVRAS